MIRRNLLMITSVANVAIAYSMSLPPVLADSISELAQKSRHLAEAGNWDEATAILQDRLALAKDAVELARLKA
jgi:hypothetical protein